MTVLTQARAAGHYRFRHVAHDGMDQAPQPALHLVDAGDHRGRRGPPWPSPSGSTPSAGRAGPDEQRAGGVVPGLLLIGVLGVLVMTSEYTSGMIRATLAAAPGSRCCSPPRPRCSARMALARRRGRRSFLAFFCGGAAFRHGISAPTLGQPGVLRAVLLGGASYCPDRAARPRARRHHPAHGGGHRRARRRRVPHRADHRRGHAMPWRPTCRSSSSGTR